MAVNVAGYDAGLVQQALQAGITGVLEGPFLDFREVVGPRGGGDVHRPEALGFETHGGAVRRAFEGKAAGRIDTEFMPPAPFAPAALMGG